jgi:hypothetical protein
MSKRPRDHPTTEAVRYPRRTPLYQEEERFITARRYSGSETVPSSTNALTAKRGAQRPPRLTLDPPLYLRTCTATWWHALARSRARPPATERGRLPPGGPSGTPPALLDRLPDRTLAQIQPLRRLGRRRALGEALLGLQQPIHHQQLAHQLVEGLTGGLPVRITTALTSSACARPAPQGASPPQRPAGRALCVP